MSGYLGNKSKMIAHHLGNMKSECNIYEIKMKDREYFTPDTLDNAKSKDYESCKFCID